MGAWRMHSPSSTAEELLRKVVQTGRPQTVPPKTPPSDEELEAFWEVLMRPA
jgi:hypothetical protein